MDWGFIAKYAPLYAVAAQVTLFVSLWGIVAAMLVGLVVALVIHAKVPVMRQVASAYVELSRNTPLLVQLFFLYFGLPKVGVTLPAEACAIIGIAFLGGSYMSEALRGGLESVAAVQEESALVLGMAPGQSFVHVVLPQALVAAVPALVANVIFLIKESSVVSGIALADLMYLTKDLIGLYYDTSEALLMLVIAYAIILIPVSVAGTVLERRLDHGRG
ncbi:MAG: amino acid ABC transporter permease [Atopobiaceae bacterium]|jgi:polar amino acid transport system permease protein|nr:amino acid ABC transporter permease [Atopobiaceae bacterium]MCI2173341.1 amino acid ABC transporter permease [Atopobiaceae bacterium]MCI2207336.1 amino acid ABC transporter permease [Atopobiaceae bacterium]